MTKRSKLEETANVMNDTQLAAALRVAVPIEHDEIIHARRERLVASLETEIAQVPVRLRRIESRAQILKGARWMAAAAVLACTLGLGALLSADGAMAQKAREAATQPSSETEGDISVQEKQISLSGKTFETESGQSKNLQLAGMTALTLDASTSLLVEGDTAEAQSLRLNRGSIRVSVPQVPGIKRRSVQVLTPHAAVSVTGTLFTVDVMPLGPEETRARTRVRVEHGSVSVQHSTGALMLGAGDSWVSPLEMEVNGAAKLSASSRSASSASSDVSRRASSRLVPSDETDSDLAAQNALLESALKAEASGNVAEALKEIELFLHEYPRSPLRPSAHAVKKRLLAQR